jgi:hypothetical protein
LAFAGTTTYSTDFTGLGDQTLLTTGYTDATFVNAIAANYHTGLENSVDFPAYPGSTGVINDAGFGNPNNPNDFGDPILVDFSVGMGAVSGYYTDPGGVTVTAFDAAGNVIDTFNGVGNDGDLLQFQLFASSGLDPIASIEIEDPGDNVFSTSLAELSYTTTPEPGSFLLLGTGLLGLAGAVRRKLAR